jgi:hypothetical protein
MNNFFEIFFQDPVMLAAGVVIVGTIAILAWALRALSETSTERKDTTYEDLQPNEPQQNTDDSAGLAEARLQAIVNQLNEINQRLIDIEKALKTTKISDQTIPMLLTPAKLEETFKRIESKMDEVAAVKSQAGDAPNISALETKLDGIHKLLIYLTDSGK